MYGSENSNFTSCRCKKVMWEEKTPTESIEFYKLERICFSRPSQRSGFTFLKYCAFWLYRPWKTMEKHTLYKPKRVRRMCEISETFILQIWRKENMQKQTFAWYLLIKSGKSSNVRLLFFGNLPFEDVKKSHTPSTPSHPQTTTTNKTTLFYLTSVPGTLY